MKGGYVPIQSDSGLQKALGSSVYYVPSAISWKWKVVFFSIPVLFIGLIAYLSVTSAESEAIRRENLRQHYSACEYSGSRIVGYGGFFGGTANVHMYDCNGVREETRRRWDLEKPR